MENSLVVLKTCKLMKTKVQVWGGDGEVWMTRKQIGECLEYKNPQTAIDLLHRNHKDRLDRYSVTFSLKATDGKYYDTILYSAKGVYEICRWSRQPRADEFYDKVYDLLEQVRKEGFYGSLTKENAMELCKKVGVTVDEYAEYRTGRTVRARLTEAKREANEVVDWSTYRFSVQDIMADTGAAHGDILNKAREKKYDRNKELAKYVQGELRFTYQGRMMIEREFPVRTYCKPAGEGIKWEFGGV